MTKNPRIQEFKKGENSFDSWNSWILGFSDSSSVADGSSIIARIGSAKTDPAVRIDKNCVAIPYAIAFFDPVPTGS